jgi:chromosome segregation ATPase
VTSREERVQELKYRIHEYDRNIDFEEKYIKEIEEEMTKLQVKLKLLEVRKAQAIRQINEFTLLMNGTKAKLSVWNEG